jgi:cell pole-organizing protein PopZ
MSDPAPPRQSMQDILAAIRDGVAGEGARNSEAGPVKVAEILEAAAETQRSEPAGRKAGAHLDAGGKTLETLAAELLRPMLQDWINANLPDIVERTVREEVRKRTGR